MALFSKPIRDFVEKVTALADSAADPSAYATQLLARLCPGVLPYELDTPAAFTFAAFNGRSLCDDVMDGCGGEFRKAVRANPRRPAPFFSASTRQKVPAGTVQ